jgi:hypothetical protein
MKLLLEYITSLGELVQCKDSKAQGLMIYEPLPFDKDKLKQLTRANGLDFIFNKADDKCDADRLFIGKVNRKTLDIEQADSFLSSL